MDHEVAQLDQVPLKALSLSDKKSKNWKVAQEFESMFLHQLFKAMRKTVPEGALGKPSNAQKIFTDMLDQEIANSASKQGTGLAELIYRSMTGNERVPEELQQSSWSATALGSYRKASSKSMIQPPAHLSPASGIQVNQWIEEASDHYNLDSSLLKSLVLRESGGNSLAVSAKGAMGLTQLMPATAQDLGVNNPWDGRQNVMGGARYLRQMLDLFDDQEDLALAAYNAGPGTVLREGGVPSYPETQEYVQKVLQRRKTLQNEVDDAI